MALTADIQQQVFDLLSRASTLSFVSADQEPSGVLGLSPGQRVMAEVLTTLPNQRVQVRVGSERFNLDLPMAVRDGQTLELTYIAGNPRTTFAIARPGATAPAVSLSDASRLLGLLVGNEHISDPRLRSSLQSISGLLRRDAGEAGVLANLMDEALTYGSRPGADQPLRNAAGTAARSGNAQTAEQSRLALFESNASQMLQQIARNSRFILTEAVNTPVVPLPLMPGQEVDAAVLGNLPGGRAFVHVAGTALELVVPRQVHQGEILRLTFIASEPKPLFALQRSPSVSGPGELSEAGRWLSVLEHSEGGVSSHQMFVLERLNTVLKNLPAGSPAFTAILDEAITYERSGGGHPGAEGQASAAVAVGPMPQSALQAGNHIVLSDDMAKLLQALIKGNRLALLEAITQQGMSQSFTPGQQLKAEVLSVLGGGHFMLQVAGQALEFSMPKGTRKGDLVTLFFITGEPRPTFLLTRFGKPGDSRVSDTSRWLSSLLGMTSGRLPAQATLGILRTLLSAPPADARQVGQMLQQGLQESGLFYESHLARWFAGDFPIEDILREPQGLLSHLKHPAPPPMGNNQPGVAKAGTGPASLDLAEAIIQKAGTFSEHEGIADPRALPVVREQLSALQSGQIVFRGELFSGQPMEWSVQEREARRNAAGQPERTWDTSLTIDLPHLGLVKARLTVDGSQVNITLRVNDPASAGQLDLARPALAEQLQSAGLIPGEIGVRHDAN